MAADIDTQKRRTYARNLAACIARNDLHSVLTVKDAQGASPVVIALGHEKVDAVFRRIENAGGSANLFVVDSNDHLHVVRMMQTRQTQQGTASEVEAADVHSNITMDFLVLYMNQQVKRSGALRVAFSGVDVEAESAPDLQLVGMAGQ